MDSSNCVPLSRCPFFVEETIVDPCVALEAADSIDSPCIPNTPLLFDARRPVELSPPTAPVERVAEPRAPPAFPDAEPAVFITVPPAAPAVDVAPPSQPPPLRAAPDAEPMPAPDAPAPRSSAPAAASAEDCAAASA